MKGKRIKLTRYYEKTCKLSLKLIQIFYKSFSHRYVWQGKIEEDAEVLLVSTNVS